MNKWEVIELLKPLKVKPHGDGSFTIECAPSIFSGDIQSFEDSIISKLDGVVVVNQKATKRKFSLVVNFGEVSLGPSSMPCFGAYEVKDLFCNSRCGFLSDCRAKTAEYKREINAVSTASELIKNLESLGDDGDARIDLLTEFELNELLEIASDLEIEVAREDKNTLVLAIDQHYEDGGVVEAEPKQEEEPPRRRRGRPPKQEAEADSDGDDLPKPKRRGRPPKQEAEADSDDLPKPRRGRPPKQEIPEKVEHEVATLVPQEDLSKGLMLHIASSIQAYYGSQTDVEVQESPPVEIEVPSFFRETAEEYGLSLETKTKPDRVSAVVKNGSRTVDVASIIRSEDGQSLEFMPMRAAMKEHPKATGAAKIGARQYPTYSLSEVKEARISRAMKSHIEDFSEKYPEILELP